MLTLYSVLVLFGVGLVAGTILAIASKVFYVEEDPRVEAVLDALPGANCGGCGYAGCEGYAIAVVSNPNIEANLCVAGSAETSITVGKLTGKIVTEADPLVSVRRCEKLEGCVAARFDYSGVQTCAAASTMGSGLGVDACPFSCLGLGDCVKVCPFDALEVKNNIVVVNALRCTGCGKCTHACPRGLLELIPKRARVMVFCSTRAKGKAVTDVCDIGCIACTLCVKKCPAQAIHVTDNILYIDHQKCLEYGPSCEEACVSACKRHILKRLCSPEELAQRAKQEARAKAEKEALQQEKEAKARAEQEAMQKEKEAKTKAEQEIKGQAE